MKNQFKIILQDIKKGNNLDLYATIVIAIIISVSSYLEGISIKVINATTLAILALIAGSLLTSRRTLSDVNLSTNNLNDEIKKLNSDEFSSNPCKVLLNKEYPDLSNSFELSKDISILASSLQSTAIKYYASFEEALQKGTNIRVLVVDPSEDVLKMMCLRTYMLKDTAELKSNVNGHIELMRKLQRIENNNGKLTIKTIPLVVPYGLMILNRHNLSSQIYVKLMPYRVPPGQYPSFELNNIENHELFTFFNNQFEKMWEDSSPLEI